MLCRYLGLFVAAAILAVAAPAARAAPPAAPDLKIVPDPAVKQGVLPNGMRYAIMNNITPAKGVSIRLAFDVGSYDEMDDEGGAAHFIEHMAFRSTRLFPQGMLDDRFALLGVRIGRDQNAFTMVNSTLYVVDLPSANPAGIASILEWMRSAADGINFSEAGVNVERNVVLAEKRDRTSTNSIVAEEVSRFQAPLLRSVNRMPIGTEASLRALTPARLKAFYDRWYRPENAILVIVGDAPVETFERAVREAFSSWAGKGPMPERAVPTPIGPRAIDAFTRSGPDLPSSIAACRLTPPRPGSTDPIEEMRPQLQSQLWSKILTKRLTEAAVRPEAGLLGAAALVNDAMRDGKFTCLMALPTGEKWAVALATAQAELRRFAATGPTDAELEFAVEDVRSVLRGGVTQSGSRASPDIATVIAASALEGEPILSPAQMLRAYDIVVDGIAPADIKARFAADWAGNGPLLAATAPKAPSREEMLAAWHANDQAAPLADYEDRGSVDWPYRDFGKAGRVAQRDVMTDPDFIRSRFENGTILNYKKTDFDKNGIEIRLRFGFGQEEYAPEDKVLAVLATSLFPEGGLGKLPAEDIQPALGTGRWDFTLNVDAHSFAIAARPLALQVETQMQLLAAYMTDPGFRRSLDDKLPTSIEMMVRMFRTDPATVAGLALEDALFPDTPSLEALQKYQMADLEKALKPILMQTPVEVTIVGDIEEEAATKAIASTFGALATRPAMVKPHDPARFHSFPATLPSPIIARHAGPPEKAAATLVWPLYVARPERRREEYAIGLMTKIFELKLRHTIRGEMGKSYMPTVASQMIDDADQGALTVSIAAGPEDVDQLVSAARKIAADLAAGDINQADLDQAREPIVTQSAKRERSNASWAGALSQAYRHPDAMSEFLDFKPAIEAVTLADVRKAAADWLGPNPAIATALPAAGAER